MIAGYILTGGKNRRMKGQKKLLLEHRGKTFLEWIIEAMKDLPHVYLSVEDAALWRSLLEEQEAGCFFGETVDNPVDNKFIFVDKSVDSPMEKSVDGFVDKPERAGMCKTEGFFVEGRVDNPVNPEDKPEDKQGDKSVDSLVEKSTVDKSADRPVDYVNKRPVDKPVDGPVDYVDKKSEKGFHHILQKINVTEDLIEDLWENEGPLGGIVTGLISCKEDALFVVACDMPAVRKEDLDLVLRQYEKERIITVARSKGKVEPLFGVYPKSALPILRKQLEEGNLRMMDALEEAGYCCVDMEKESLLNVNTVEEYRKLSPFIFAISGYKNSGKTTLVTALIPELTKKGYKVAVIKHDGHDFEPDVPGTDSYRHRKAGAYGTAVFSANRYMITKEWSGMDEGMLIQAFPEADIILIEGLKDSDYPKYICNYPKEPLIDAKKLAEEIIRLRSTNPGNRL